jgi:hypothetical protein
MIAALVLLAVIAAVIGALSWRLSSAGRVASDVAPGAQLPSLDDLKGRAQR